MRWEKATAWWDENHLCFGIGCVLYFLIDGTLQPGPVLQDIAHSTVMTAAEHKLERQLTKDDPYLARDYLGEN